MKKLLFLSLVAMIAGVVSAQTFDSKKSGKPMMVKRHPAMYNQLVSTPAPKADMGNGQRTFAGYNNSNIMKSVKQQGKSTFTPMLKNFSAAPRKAASMLEEYIGYGLDYSVKKNVKWHMKPGTAETQEGETINVLYDVIPVPSFLKDNDIETVPVRYEFNEKEGTVIIPAQTIIKRTYEDDSESYMLLFSAINEEGSIVLTLSEDGNLEPIKGEQIVYGDWDTPEITYDDEDNYEGYNGYYVLIQDVKYFKPGEEPVYIPQPEFEPEGLYLHASISPSAYGYTNSLQFMPAFAQQTFKNYTTDEADAWSWKIDKLTVNDEGNDYVVEETLTADTRDFIITTTDATYKPAELVASFEGRSSDPYIWGLAHEENKEAKGYVYCGFLGDNYDMSDGTYSIISRCDPSNGFSIYSSMGTPEVNSRKDTLTSLILYQGKPTAPIYFEGINFLVWDFQTVEGKDFTLKCKIQKVTRNPETGRLTLGDVIATSDAKLEDVVEGYQGNGWNLWQINWNSFQIEDEYGFTNDISYMMVEDEFAIVFEGWDNGTFNCSPMGEGSSNGNGLAPIYCQVANDDAVYNYYAYFSHLYAGFNSAIYGYMHTDDDTNLVFGAEGGIANLHVSPMLYSSDEETGEHKARIFIDSIIVDGEPFDIEEDEEGNLILPEWIAFAITNENYDEGIDYDLMIGVDELPENTESRTAQIVFMQEGAYLKINITQGEGQQGTKGDVNNDGTVDVADISAIISVMAGTAEYAAADVNGDGTVDVADISMVISIMAEN